MVEGPLENMLRKIIKQSTVKKEPKSTPRATGINKITSSHTKVKDTEISVYSTQPTFKTREPTRNHPEVKVWVVHQKGFKRSNQTRTQSISKRRWKEEEDRIREAKTIMRLGKLGCSKETKRKT